MTEPRLGVVGDMTEDIVVLMGAEFAPGSDTPSRIVRRQGGSAANVAVAASSLVATRFYGCVGDDECGDWLECELAGAMLSTTWEVRLQVSDVAPTGTIVVLVDAKGERHMFPDRGANTQLLPIEDAQLRELTALHATAYSLTDEPTAGSVTAALTTLRDWGRVTSLDVSSTTVIKLIGLEHMLGMLDSLRPTFVMANAAEAALLGLDVIGASASYVVLVKRGPGPALVRTRLGAWEVPTTALEVEDTTGAGDAFAAGVLAHVINSGLTHEELLDSGETTARAFADAGHKAATAKLR